MKTLKIYKLENGAKRASNMPESFQNKKNGTNHWYSFSKGLAAKVKLEQLVQWCSSLIK
jgi:hypothetical protein